MAAFGDTFDDYTASLKDVRSQRRCVAEALSALRAKRERAILSGADTAALDAERSRLWDVSRRLRERENELENERAGRFVRWRARYDALRAAIAEEYGADVARQMEARAAVILNPPAPKLERVTRGTGSALEPRNAQFVRGAARG